MLRESMWNCRVSTRTRLPVQLVGGTPLLFFTALHPLWLFCYRSKIILSLLSNSPSSLLLSIIIEMNKYRFYSPPSIFFLPRRNRKDFCLLSGDDNLEGFTFDFYMSFYWLNKQKRTVATPTKMGFSIGDESTKKNIIILLLPKE